MQVDQSPIRMSVLLSGGGRTLQNLLDRIATKQLAAQIDLVIASDPNAFGLNRAKHANVPTAVISPWRNPTACSQQAFDLIRKAGSELVICAGFLKLLVVPDDFTNRVINIHPSLIPAFCGKGMYGEHVHEAAIKRGVKVSGCTVHLVDNEYDHGTILLQKIVEVAHDETAESLAAKVFAVEQIAYPEAIEIWRRQFRTPMGRHEANTHR